MPFVLEAEFKVLQRVRGGGGEGRTFKFFELWAGFCSTRVPSRHKAVNLIHRWSCTQVSGEGSCKVGNRAKPSETMGGALAPWTGLWPSVEETWGGGQG